MVSVWEGDKASTMSPLFAGGVLVLFLCMGERGPLDPDDCLFNLSFCSFDLASGIVSSTKETGKENEYE